MHAPDDDDFLFYSPLARMLISQRKQKEVIALISFSRSMLTTGIFSPRSAN